MNERIPLSDMIAHITGEIRAAHARASDAKNAVMQFEECEFEFAVEAEKSAKGGIQVWILNLGAAGKKTDSNTVRIKYGKLPGDAPWQAEQQSAGQGHGKSKPGPKI